MRKIFSLFVAALVCVSTFATTYTVAGDSEAVFGMSWSPTSAANDMTLVEGSTYQFVKTGVELFKCTIKFKVCEDHGWTVAYPAQDYELSIPAAGIYDITITFDAGESKAVNATAEKKGDSNLLPSIMMHGNFTGTWTNTAEFTVADDQATASLAITLAKGSYSFGMRIGGEGNWTSNGSAFTRENNSYVINSGNGNLSLAADASGEYTFTWTFETNTLAITFPQATDEPDPEINYYLVGDPRGWVAAEANKFAATEVPGEYKITTTLTAGETLKVLGVQGSIQTWYPDGEGNEFSVTPDYAGEKDIYFRPAGNADWSDFGGYIYIAPNAPIIGPIVVKDLKLVPGVWTTDNAVLGCWAWGEEAEGAWSVFAGEGDTLTAKINAKADSVIFVRFANEAEPAWNDELIWNKTASMKIADCGLFFVNAWDNYSWCEPVKVYEYSQLWKANAETPLEANTVYMDNHLLNIKSVYATSLKTQSFTAGEEEFTHAITVRTNGYPNAENLNGAEKAGSTPLILTAKKDAVITLYYRHQSSNTVRVDPEDNKSEIVSCVHNQNDSKDLIVFDQADIATKIEGEFTILTENAEVTEYVYVAKKVSVTEGHVYTLAASGTTLQLSGILAEGDAYVPVHANGYYLLGNFNDWTPSDDYLFVANGDQEGEFKLDVTFAAGDTLKVAYVENDAAQTWYGAENYGVPAESLGEATVYFRPEAYTEWTALSGHIYIAPKQPVIEPTLANGYYLIGNPWSVESLSEDVLFAANPGAEGEYMLNTTLTEGQEIKVVAVENDALKTWFPDGMDNAYTVDAAHAGNVTIYFRPDGLGGEGWYEGFFYIQANGSTAIGNTAADAKAVKVLRNGMLLIEKNGKTYNVLGAMVR